MAVSSRALNQLNMQQSEIVTREMDFYGKLATGEILAGAGNVAVYPMLTVIGGATPVIAYATVSGGAVTGVVLSLDTATGAGSGYNTPPTVTLNAGGGSGATFLATVANGEVTGISVTAPGSGYSQLPSLAIPVLNTTDNTGVNVQIIGSTAALGFYYLIFSNVTTSGGNTLVGEGILFVTR